MSPFKMCSDVGFTVFVVAALFNVQTGHGFGCYVCETVAQAQCKDPFVPSSEIKTMKGCSKNCLKADSYDKDGKLIETARSCADLTPCKGENSLPLKDGGTAYCYYCSGELCNTSPASS